jgi:probable F420-dependent oxidoreductase
MLLDATLSPGATLTELAAAARLAEQEGHAGLFCPETAHDPFLCLMVASQATARIELGTSIAVAFARSPMTTAVSANDLHRYCRGRMVLGLGSQVRAHIERRFSMPWSHPARRMREYVLALRAIWASWNDRVPLRFEGEFYHHSLMTPFFDPGPNPFGTPKVWLAGVGAAMTEVAGEVADGLWVHSFTTERYLKEVTLPALARGAARAGRSVAELEVACPGFVVTGTTRPERDAAAAAVRAQIAFYGSTPAYRPVLELHGFGAVHTALHLRSRRGQWAEMAALVSDEMLDAFAVVAPPDELGAAVLRRFGSLLDRFSLAGPVRLAARERRALVAELAAGKAPALES